MIWRGFGSDNQAGVHPRVLELMTEVNHGHAHGYGADMITEKATGILRERLGVECDIAFVFNGTGANCVCFAATCRPWEGVVCAESAHINEDECGAPERIGGIKLITTPAPDGKLTPALVRPHLKHFGFEHAVQPRVISISNVSELGTVYTAEQTAELSALAREHGMLLHVDGARLANAAAATGGDLAAITSRAGVDMVSLGGTKNGMLGGEAVVLMGEARTEHLKYVRKQSGQLASKMRFISAQFIAMFEGDLWLELATHANSMAAKLSGGLVAAGQELAVPADANEVFVWLPAQLVAPLQERFHFYEWGAGEREGQRLVRLVCSWDTAEEDVQALLDAVSSGA